MAYILLSFDSLTIPTYLQDGDQQNIGTGSALTNFTQLAGGGFFDNYGSSVSPRAIQSITKTGFIWGDTAADTRDTLDNWRAKIGVRGKLTVQYDDSTERWQYARLTDVSTPRRGSDKGNWLVVNFTWMTADQKWFGTAHPVQGWTWGDGSWTFGDGTATFGEEFEEFTFDANPDSFSLSNGGNVDATDLVISLRPNEAVSSLTISNSANGASMTFSDTITAGTELIINVGAMSITNGGDNAFSGFANNQIPWMPLAPGTNTITVQYVAADSLNGDIIDFRWKDAWA